VLVLTRFSVSEAEGAQFADQAADALAALADCPGYLRGHLGREVDDVTSWLLLTEWAGVGAYRRALSRYDVRVRAIPLLARGQQEPGAYEVLSTVGPAGATAVVSSSDRAANADTAHPGDAGTTAASSPPVPADADGPAPRDQSRGLRGAAPLRPGDQFEQETS
jgi:quinol monooxygenase YgiN